MAHAGAEHHAATVQRTIERVLEAADPRRAVREATCPALDGFEYAVLAAGKASVAMTRGLLDRLGSNARVRGVVIGPPGSVARAAEAGLDGLAVFEADHPLPTERNVLAARTAQRHAMRARSGGVTKLYPPRLVVLLSGGASAHLTLPRDGVSLHDLRAVTDALLRAGAPIENVNCVRKHCEVLKGGGLASVAGDGLHAAFVLSDVVGDRLDVIASGPTVPDPTTFADALGVIERWGVGAAAPAVVAYLRRGAAGSVCETAKPGEIDTAATSVVAGNGAAVAAASVALRDAGYAVVDRRAGVEGEARDRGGEFAKALLELQRASRNRAALVWGGESTVTVRGSGRGGRNQEAALAAAIELDRSSGITVAMFATDGGDGPTDAAGAVASGGACADARRLGLDPAAFLAANDSHAFFARVGCLLRTGPTGTNVNDVWVGLVG